MTFTRSHSPLMFSYRLRYFVILHGDGFVMDLGAYLVILTRVIQLSRNRDPSLHVDMVCCKALKAFAFVIRLTKDFRLNSSFKVIFILILEYGTIIWEEHKAANARQLERVQRKFFLGITSPPHDYHHTSNHLGLVSFAEWIKIIKIC